MRQEQKISNRVKKIKTILIGTPEFAATIFKKLQEVKPPNIEIIAVITAPDKPVGRKQILTPPPVKKWALENNLPVLQPDKIRNPEWIEKIRKLAPDLIILAAYGQIIPKEILDITSPRQRRGKYSSLNIHPSLLPKYRGASPIQTVILNGDKETGVTIILMDEEMDHGDIISNSKFLISNKLTYEKLSEKLADLGAELLINALPDWISGKIKPKPQDHSKASFCKIIKKEDGKIDWGKSAEEIERQVRAYSIWPIAYSNYDSKRLKILDADPSTTLGASKKNGEVFLADKKELAVQTGNEILILKQVQLEGKKPMPAKDFLNGHPEIIGAILK